MKDEFEKPLAVAVCFLSALMLLMIPADIILRLTGIGEPFPISPVVMICMVVDVCTTVVSNCFWRDVFGRWPWQSVFDDDGDSV